jgi:uncharacterized membrane protein
VRIQPNAERHRLMTCVRLPAPGLAGAVALCLLPLLVHAGLAGGVLAGAAAAAALLWSGASHASLNLGLCLMFGRSLLAGRGDDLVTGLARRLQGPLSPEMAAYTRGVTRLWCLYFAGQLAVSAALFLLAPRAVWSLFVNVLDLPLALLMFAVEYTYRRHRFRHHAHVSLAATVAAFARRA